MDNVLDPNTTDANRSITIKIGFKPNKNDRSMLNVTADVKPTLAPRKGASTQFFIGKEYDGTLEASELYKGQVKGQMSVDDVVESNKNDVVISIETAK